MSTHSMCGMVALAVPLPPREAEAVAAVAKAAGTTKAGILRDALWRAGFRIKARKGDPDRKGPPPGSARSQTERNDRNASLPVRRCARCGREGRFEATRIGGADWCPLCARSRFRVRRDKHDVSVADAGIVGATPGFL